MLTLREAHIYNSRNLCGLIDVQMDEVDGVIYNSRNLCGLIDSYEFKIENLIYNSRNLCGLIDTATMLQTDASSTIVEIYVVW